MASTVVPVVLVLVVIVVVQCSGSQGQETSLTSAADDHGVSFLEQQLPQASGKNSLMETAAEGSHPEDVFQGRKLKARRRLLLKALVFLKALWLGVFMPLALIFALASSWQAATISLVALGSTAFLGLKTGPVSHPPHQVHPSSLGLWQDREWNLEPEEYKRRRRQ